MNEIITYHNATVMDGPMTPEQGKQLMSGQKTFESGVPATSMAVKITSNRWTSDKTLIATGTSTNTSAVPVTVTKVVANGFDGNQNLVLVAHRDNL